MSTSRHRGGLAPWGLFFSGQLFGARRRRTPRARSNRRVGVGEASARRRLRVPSDLAWFLGVRRRHAPRCLKKKKRKWRPWAGGSSVHGHAGKPNKRSQQAAGKQAELWEPAASSRQAASRQQTAATSHQPPASRQPAASSQEAASQAAAGSRPDRQPASTTIDHHTNTAASDFSPFSWSTSTADPSAP